MSHRVAAITDATGQDGACIAEFLLEQGLRRAWPQGLRDDFAGLADAVMLSVYEGMIAVFVYERWLDEKAAASDHESATVVFDR